MRLVREQPTLLVNEPTKIEFISSICFNACPLGEAADVDDENLSVLLIKRSDSLRFIPLTLQQNSAVNLDLSKCEEKSQSFRFLPPPASAFDDGIPRDDHDDDENDAAAANITVDVSRGFFTCVAGAERTSKPINSKSEIRTINEENNGTNQDAAGNSIFCVVCSSKKTSVSNSCSRWTLCRFDLTAKSSSEANGGRNTNCNENTKKSSRKRKSRLAALERIEEVVAASEASLALNEECRKSYRLTQRYCGNGGSGGGGTITSSLPFSVVSMAPLNNTSSSLPPPPQQLLNSDHPLNLCDDGSDVCTVRPVSMIAAVVCKHDDKSIEDEAEQLRSLAPSSPPVVAVEFHLISTSTLETSASFSLPLTSKLLSMQDRAGTMKWGVVQLQQPELQVQSLLSASRCSTLDFVLYGSVVPAVDDSAGTVPSAEGTAAADSLLAIAVVSINSNDLNSMKFHGWNFLRCPAAKPAAAAASNINNQVKISDKIKKSKKKSSDHSSSSSPSFSSPSFSSPSFSSTPDVYVVTVSIIPPHTSVYQESFFCLQPNLLILWSNGVYQAVSVSAASLTVIRSYSMCCWSDGVDAGGGGNRMWTLPLTPFAVMEAVWKKDDEMLYNRIRHLPSGELFSLLSSPLLSSSSSSDTTTTTTANDAAAAAPSAVSVSSSFSAASEEQMLLDTEIGYKFSRAPRELQIVKVAVDCGSSSSRELQGGRCGRSKVQRPVVYSVMLLMRSSTQIYYRCYKSIHLINSSSILLSRYRSFLHHTNNLQFPAVQRTVKTGTEAAGTDVTGAGVADTDIAGTDVSSIVGDVRLSELKLEIVDINPKGHPELLETLHCLSNGIPLTSEIISDVHKFGDHVNLLLSLNLLNVSQSLIDQLIQLNLKDCCLQCLRCPLVPESVVVYLLCNHTSDFLLPIVSGFSASRVQLIMLLKQQLPIKTTVVILKQLCDWFLFRTALPEVMLSKEISYHDDSIPSLSSIAEFFSILIDAKFSELICSTNAALTEALRAIADHIAITLAAKKNFHKTFCQLFALVDKVNNGKPLKLLDASIQFIDLNV